MGWILLSLLFSLSVAAQEEGRFQPLRCALLLELNLNAQIAAQNYSQHARRNSRHYSLGIGEGFDRRYKNLKPGDNLLLPGGGMGLVGLEASYRKRVHSVVINAQDFWSPWLRAVRQPQSVSELPLSSHILEVGLAFGLDLKLKEIFSLMEEKYKRVTENDLFDYRVGYVENLLPLSPEKFKFLVDYYDGYFYSANRALLLEEYYNSLDEGGEGIVVVGHRPPHGRRHSSDHGFPTDMVETSRGKISLVDFMVRSYPKNFQLVNSNTSTVIYVLIIKTDDLLHLILPLEIDRETRDYYRGPNGLIYPKDNLYRVVGE